MTQHFHFISSTHKAQSIHTKGHMHTIVNYRTYNSKDVESTQMMNDMS